MVETRTETPAALLRGSLRGSSASARLQAALTAGTRPDESYIEVLVERCEVEPDFFVRDMLTWALTRHDRSLTVLALLPKLRAESAQARSQALHTLSKIGDPAAWPAITPELLGDGDIEVARVAWRTAAGLVPAGAESELARQLATQLGRGDQAVQRSLSRAFARLGGAAEQVVEQEIGNENPVISAHALATLTIMADPDAGFEAAIAEAKRVAALRAVPRIAE